MTFACEGFPVPVEISLLLLLLLLFSPLGTEGTEFNLLLLLICDVLLLVEDEEEGNDEVRFERFGNLDILSK